MYIVSFHLIFNENANALSQRLGVPFVQEMKPKPNDIIIVFGAHECPDKLLAVQAAVPVKYIIIQSEQFHGKAFDNKFYMQLFKDNVILDFSKENIKRLKQHLPTPVYSLYFYDFFQTDTPPFESRPIDFFFCGAPSPVRESIIREYKALNPDYTYEIDFSYSYLNPVDLNEKLKQVKYVLNIPFYKDNALETHRINRAISLGCQVVSLPSADREMNLKYEPYIHIVPKLTDFSLLLELEPKRTYLQLMEDFGIYQIQSNINGIRYAEKKLNEKNALNK
jgi:hypothetical protein